MLTTHTKSSINTEPIGQGAISQDAERKTLVLYRKRVRGIGPEECGNPDRRPFDTAV
jgi:hypothetical protein